MNMQATTWSLIPGTMPLVGVALHDGHDMRPEVHHLTALDSNVRLREEDPYTGLWTDLGGPRIIANRSRFEVDLNRPREKALYLQPEDAWGLRVWKSELPSDVARTSLAQYDAFYTMIRSFISEVSSQHGVFVVYDIHTYNHRRKGPDGPPADPAGNPEVNIGTGTMDRTLWGPVVDRFINDLHNFPFMGRHLDVRENVKFKGGAFASFVHKTFPCTACVLSIEFKKFFMDEWSGVCCQETHASIMEALRSTVPGVLQTLSSSWSQGHTHV